MKKKQEPPTQAECKQIKTETGMRLSEIPKRAKAIRLKCLDCCCGQRSEVRKCTCFDCPLWPYRFGPGPLSILRKEGTLLGVSDASDDTETEVEEEDDE